jgi:ribosomal protein S8E
MSLTVPTSGSIAGRSANLSAVPDQTGAIVGQFAETLANVGLRLEEDRLSREANRLSVDMTRDLNNLNLELRSIGDPDVLDATWTQRNAELRQSYLEGQTEDGRPRVDPRNRERMGLQFDQVSNALALQVGARSLEARQSQRLATDMQMQHEIVTAGATADASTRALFYDIYDEQTAELVNAGILSPEEAQRNRMAVRAGTTNAAAIAAIEADPEGFLAAADAGEFNDLGGETVARYTVQANNALQARDAEAQRQAETALNERNREIAARLTDIRQTAQSGAANIVVDEQFMADPAVQASPEFAATQAAIDLQAEGKILPQMTVRALETLLVEEEANPVAYAYQAERQQLLRNQIEASRTGWSTDPVTFAAEAGFWVPDLEPFDPANPGAMAASLAQRGTLSDTLMSGGFISEPRLLSVPERQQIIAQAGVDQDPADRATYAATLMTTLPPGGPDSASAMITDPVFLHMGSLVATGTPPAVAEEVFRGQQALALGNVSLPSDSVRLAATGPTLGMIFGNLAGGEREQARVRAATDALYAARMRVQDPGNTAVNFNTTEYRQALHEVMGGSGPYDNSQSLGGVRKLNGFDTVLPRNLSSALAENAIGRLGYDDTGNWAPVTMVSQLVSASITGYPPEFVSDPNFWDQMQTAQIMAVGDDQYAIVFDTQTGLRALQNRNGQGEFRFSMTRLVQEVPQ